MAFFGHARPSRRSILGGALAVAAAVVAAAAVAHSWKQPTAIVHAATAPRTPVVAAVAHQGDIGVYITGLGAVTPLATISVKTRVDGQLVKVSYAEGALVRKGDALAEIDPRPYQVQLAQAEAQLDKDQAALLNAQADLERYESLIVRNAVSQQVLATQRATVAQDQAAVKTDDANIAAAKLNISYCHITAPITGRVGLRLVDPGNMVSAAAGTTLAVVTQTQPISVIFTIPEQQVPNVLPQVRAGHRLRVDAMARDLTSVLASGQLTTIDNEIDQTTGTLRLRATLPNKDEALFPNQFINARLLLQDKKGVTLVPNAGVQRAASSAFVYVVKPDHTVTVRPVALGTVDAAQSEVVKGLSPGEVVVTQGVDRLQEGTAVTAEISE